MLKEHGGNPASSEPAAKALLENYQSIPAIDLVMD
jgi:hypothetical protein